MAVYYSNHTYAMNLSILYIDPGSGSLLFQVLISGLLTVLVFFKKGVHFLKTIFSLRKARTAFKEEEESR